ncbi:MAG TPA: hypothetical protein VIJ67_02515 [Pseudolabrys sp.]
MRDPADAFRLAYSPKDAGPALGIRTYWIRCAIKRGDLIARKVGMRSVIPADELLAWIKTFPPTPSSKGKRP